MKTVNVLYKYADGAHFFVSDDEETVGLCVAHKDPAKAFKAVSVSLNKLFKENHKVDVNFVPSLSFEAFLKWYVDHAEASAKKPTPGIAGLFKWDPSVGEMVA